MAVLAECREGGRDCNEKRKNFTLRYVFVFRAKTIPDNLWELWRVKRIKEKIFLQKGGKGCTLYI